MTRVLLQRLILCSLLCLAAASDLCAREITAHPDTLDFGLHKPGSHATAELELASSSDEPLEVIVSSSGEPFSVGPDTFSVAGKSGKSLIVEFVSSRLGEHSGVLIVEVKKLFSSEKITVPLFATVVRPEIEFIPEASVGLQMGSVPIGETETRTLLLSNPSPVALRIDSLYFESGAGPLELEPVGALELAAGEQVTLTVSYTPGRGGELSNRLLVLSPDLDPPHTHIAVSGSGLAPVAAVSPLPEIGVDFDATEVGASSRRTVTALNKGQSRLDIVSIEVDGTGFSLSSAIDSLSVSPSQRRQIELQFKPVREGLARGSLRFGTNDPGAPHIELPLEGQARVTPAKIEILNDTTIAFGRVALGKNSREHLLLWNRGGDAFTVELGLEDDSPEFELATSAILLQPGQSGRAELRFQPNDVGERLSSLRVLTEAGHRQFRLEGTGEFLRLSPTVEDFGRVPVGETASKVVELTNIGNADFTITRMTSSSDDFTIITQVSAQNEFLLPANGLRSLPLNVSFAPAARGLSTGLLRVEGFWSEGTETFEILLNGTGIAAEIELHPSGTLDFDYVVLGESQVRTLVATNTGDTALRVEASPLTREAHVDPAAFSLQPGESTRLAVSFQPETLGDRFGQILLVSNDVRDRAQPIKIKGHGALNAIDLSAITSVRVSRKSGSRSQPVAWTNAPIVLPDGTKVDLVFELPDSLHAALVGRKIEIEWVELDENYDPKGGPRQLEVQIYDDESGTAVAEDLNLRLQESGIRRVRLRLTTRSYPGAPPHSISQILEAGGWKWEFEAKPLVSFLTIRPGRDYKGPDGQIIKGKTERLIGLPGIAFAGWHNSENPSVSGVHLTAIGNVLEALSTENAIAVSLGVAVSLYKDRFLFGFGWDIYDSRPKAKRKGTQDYIMTMKYSGWF